jgi:hypothetical protein
MEKYWDKCDYGFWIVMNSWENVFKPFLTDEIVDEVMSKISKVK